MALPSLSHIVVFKKEFEGSPERRATVSISIDSDMRVISEGALRAFLENTCDILVKGLMRPQTLKVDPTMTKVQTEALAKIEAFASTLPPVRR